jgi:hypothetical protein
MFKSFIKSVKIYSTIVSLLAFTPLWASQPLLDLRDDMAGRNGAVLLPSNFDGAWYTHLSLKEFLNKNRLMWYTGFAGFGSGMALSNAFEVDSTEMYMPWMLGGLAVGLLSGGIISKNCPNVEQYMQNRWVNIGTGLLSFVPWIVFGATKPNTHP